MDAFYGLLGLGALAVLKYFYPGVKRALVKWLRTNFRSISISFPCHPVVFVRSASFGCCLRLIRIIRHASFVSFSCHSSRVLVISVSICIVLNLKHHLRFFLFFFSMSTSSNTSSILPKELKEEMDIIMKSVFGVVSLLLMLLLKCLYSTVKKAWSSPKFR